MSTSADNISPSMNDCSYTLRHTGQVFAEIPSIQIPTDEQIIFNEHGWPSFVIETSSGPITCRPTCMHMECKGSAEALTAYGLLRQEWMPGNPGNNKTRQSVVFTESGPALAIGRFARNQYSASSPYLVVIRQGKLLVIDLPMNPEQKEWYEAIEQRVEQRRNQTFTAALPRQQSNNVIQITSRPRLQPGDYAYLHLPGHKNDGVVVMIERESYSEKGKYSVTSLGMPFTYDDGSIGFEAVVQLDPLRRISRAFFESRPIFKVG